MNVSLPTLALLGVISFYFPSQLPGSFPQTGLVELSAQADSLPRTAHVYVPENYNPAKPPPLVIGLHGAGGNGPRFLRSHRWDNLADREGLLVLVPTGLPIRPQMPAGRRNNPNIWNSGQLRAQAPRADIDDVAYILRLLDELAETFPYQPEAVFLCGHSNGSTMGFLLIQHASQRFRAFGAVAGYPASAELKLTHPVPTLLFYGTEDPLLPVDGGMSTTPWGSRETLPIAQYNARWAAAMNTEINPKIIWETNDERKLLYPAIGDSGPDFIVRHLLGHGHAWPGSGKYGQNAMIESATGPSTATIDATEEIWAFFSQTLQSVSGN